MEKQKRQFIILCICIIVFAGVFFGLKAFNRYQTEQEAARAEAEKIVAVTLSVEDIREFSYQYEGTEISFGKEEDIWYCQEDKTINISQAMISAMLSSMTEITASQQITDVQDVSEYGFSKPLNVIRLKLGEDEITITIGAYNEITGQYYLMVSNDSNVYLVDSTIYSAFQKSVEDLTETEEEE